MAREKKLIYTFSLNKCFYKTLNLSLKVENCLHSDKSCEVPKLNFSSLMLQIWECVCTPNGPHMFTDVEELNLNPLTDLILQTGYTPNAV